MIRTSLLVRIVILILSCTSTHVETAQNTSAVRTSRATPRCVRRSTRMCPLLQTPCHRGGLVTHIQQGHCSAFCLRLDWQVPYADRPQFREYANRHAWQALVEASVLIQVIREHCIVCNRLLTNGKERLQRIHRMHQALWAASMHFTAEIFQQRCT